MPPQRRAEFALHTSRRSRQSGHLGVPQPPRSGGAHAAHRRARSRGRALRALVRDQLSLRAVADQDPERVALARERSDLDRQRCAGERPARARGTDGDAPFRVPAGVRSYPEILRAHGFATALFGKCHSHDWAFGARAFEHFRPVREHVYWDPKLCSATARERCEVVSDAPRGFETEVVADAALAWLAPWLEESRDDASSSSSDPSSLSSSSPASSSSSPSACPRRPFYLEVGRCDMEYELDLFQ